MTAAQREHGLFQGASSDSAKKPSCAAVEEARNEEVYRWKSLTCVRHESYVVEVLGLPTQPARRNLAGE